MVGEVILLWIHVRCLVAHCHWHVLLVHALASVFVQFSRSHVARQVHLLILW